MPKQKTHKGTKKRFRLTATGKVKHRRAGTSPQRRLNPQPREMIAARLALSKGRPRIEGNAKARADAVLSLGDRG